MIQQMTVETPEAALIATDPSTGCFVSATLIHNNRKVSCLSFKNGRSHQKAARTVTGV